MALKTPQQYLDEIRARELTIYYRGQRLANPVDHPVAAPAARCLAEVYAAALDPDCAALMTTDSPLCDGPVNVSNILWRSREDLISTRPLGAAAGPPHRRAAPCARRGSTPSTRSPWSPTRCDRERGTALPRAAARLRRARAARGPRGLRRHDRRARRPLAPARASRPTRDLFVRVVDRDAGGVVLRGAKAHQTSAVHCHEHMVLPMTCGPDEGAWAVACAVPSDAPGITHVYARQPSDSRRGGGRAPRRRPAAPSAAARA